MENLFDVLQERGFVYQASEPDALKRRLEQPVTLYCGFDPTAPSLHAGHLVQIMMLAWAQRCGHRPIALVGGGTTMIGDPSHRDQSRPILSEDRIAEHAERIREQLSKFFDFSDGRALMRNNAVWLTELPFIGFMRDIGSRFSVNEVLRLEAYRTRLEAGGLTFLEFSYVLMQSYDFLHLYTEDDCILQVGGSDQWGNITSGADLIRRVTGGEAYALCSPLLTTSTGAKMGKTAAGALWLDPDLTSPYEYYQYFRNTPDPYVGRWLAIFTFLPLDEVRRLGSLEGAESNAAKDVLAFEATKILHGEEAARGAQDAARALFAGSGSGEDIPTIELEKSVLDAGIPAANLFREVGLAKSANEARQLIKQGGASINGQHPTDPMTRIDLSSAPDGQMMLSAGRKRHMRVVLV